MLLPELLNCFRSFPVVVLTGPRQVGKTSLLQKAFSDAMFVSADAGSVAEAASSSPEEFLDRLGTVVAGFLLSRWSRVCAGLEKVAVSILADGWGDLYLPGIHSFPLTEEGLRS